MSVSRIGVEAIRSSLRQAYPVGLHEVTLSDVGPPLAGILAMRVQTDWVLVTLGLTQLDGAPQGYEVSGWGKEITMRVAGGDAEEPPQWAAQILVELAEDVVRSRGVWDDEESVDVESIEGGIGGALFLSDPDLQDQQTALGRVGFIRAIGITESQLEEDPSELAAEMKARNPLLVSDPGHVDRQPPHPSELFPGLDASASEIEKVWVELEHELHVARPGLAGRLAGPATREAIAESEQQLGRALPEDLRASYLRHDGECTGDAFTGLFGDARLNSLDELTRTWRLQAEIDRPEESVTAEGAVQACLWNPAWIPLAGDSGYFFCVDLDPAPGGTVGQVIYLWREPQRRVVASSLAAFLRRQLERLRSGALSFDDDDGRLVDGPGAGRT